MSRAAAVALLIALVLTLNPGGAQAQLGTTEASDGSGGGSGAESGGASTEGSGSGPVTAEDLQSLVDTIEDEAQRAQLLTNLRALIEASRGEAEQARSTLADTVIGAFIGRLSESTGDIRQGVLALADRLEQLPDVAEDLVERGADPDTFEKWLTIAGVFVVVILGGLMVESLVSRALRRPRRAMAQRQGMGLFLRAVLLTGRIIMDLVPIAVFAGAIYAALTALGAEREARVTVLAVVQVYVVLRVVLVLARALLAPASPTLRLFPLSDGTAWYLYVWIRRLALVGVIGLFLISAAPLLGLSPLVYDVLLRLLGLVIALMVIVFILRIRERVARGIGGRGDSASLTLFRGRIAAVWHVLAIAYVVAAYVIWATEMGDGFAYLIRATVLTAVIVAIAAGLQSALVKALHRGFRVGPEARARNPEAQRRADRYFPIASLAVRALLWAVAGFAVLAAWGIDAFGWWVTPAGAEVLSAFVSIVVVVVGATFVWEFASSAIERYLARRTDAGKATARVRTLLPLARNALLIVLSVMVVLIVLSEIGVDIGPLLAGAGVLGLAVGFGAQKMVQDVITGAFLLFEDALAVGDVVTVAGIGGAVEGLSIRSIRLRDLSGNVHTIPFSSVDQVTNMTKEFSYYLMDIGVAYREDTDYVTEVVKAIIDEMRTEPDYDAVILEPLEVLGVDQFADSAVIIKARVKTLPIKQWMVGREFNRRMKKRFDELGIEIPFPHQTIYFGIDRAGQAPAARVRLEGADVRDQGSGARDREPVIRDQGSGPGQRPSHPHTGASSDLPDPDQGEKG